MVDFANLWCMPVGKASMMCVTRKIPNGSVSILPSRKSSIVSAGEKSRIQRVLCAFPKDKTPLLIIVCCWILLEESSFQKHPECPFDQPSKILQSSLTEYLIPYFTLAFCHIQNGKLIILLKIPPIVILNAYCMVGMPPFPLAVCWPCSYMQHVSIFTW